MGTGKAWVWLGEGVGMARGRGLEALCLVAGGYRGLWVDKRVVGSKENDGRV